MEHATQSLLIDEYSNAHEEYPAIGSGSVTHLNGNIYVNTFGLREYNDCIAQGRMSVMGKCKVGKRDLMRYRLMSCSCTACVWTSASSSATSAAPWRPACLRRWRFSALPGRSQPTMRTRRRSRPRAATLATVMYRQFLSGMSNLRDQARNALPAQERALLFGDGEK